MAVVFAFDQATGRYVVELESGGGGRKSVRPENLTAKGAATGVVAARVEADLPQKRKITLHYDFAPLGSPSHQGGKGSEA